MKFIVLLVFIFAIATAKVHPDVILESFSTKLGLTQQQQAGLQTCALEIRKAALPLIADGREAVKARLLSFVLADDDKHREVISTIVEKFQTEVPACKQLVLEVASVFANSSISNDERYAQISQMTKYRVQKYIAEIFSTVVETLEAHARGNSKIVGENLATIFQLITGLSHPEILVDYFKKYDENHKDVNETSILETDRLIQQTLNSAAKELAKELGRQEEISQERAKGLRVAFEGFVQTFINTTSQVRSIPTSVGKKFAAPDVFRDLIKAGVVVTENVRTIVKIFNQIHDPTDEAITQPESKIAENAALKNSFVRLPTFQRKSVDLSSEWKHHHGHSAGKALAGLLKALFNNLSSPSKNNKVNIDL